MEQQEQDQKDHLLKVAKVMFQKKWDNLSPAEQDVLNVTPSDLPFIFINLDKFKNEVSQNSRYKKS